MIVLARPLFGGDAYTSLCFIMSYRGRQQNEIYPYAKLYLDLKFLILIGGVQGSKVQSKVLLVLVLLGVTEICRLPWPRLGRAVHT
jgi:hypothetical protein